MSDDEIIEMIVRADTDKDGKVSFDKFWYYDPKNIFKKNLKFKMNKGENVVILNYSEWIIQLGLYIYFFLLLAFMYKIIYLFPIKKTKLFASSNHKKFGISIFSSLRINIWN